MDPLIILSVAGTVVQFTDFGLKVFAEGRQLYKSSRGVLTANEELELVTADLRALVMKVGGIHVSEAAESASDEDREAEVNFGKICCDATQLADELIEKLDKLKLKGDKRRIWESFRKAIESAWSKDQAKAPSQRFEGLRKAVESHALFSIRTNLSRNALEVSSQFTSLDQKTQLILSSLLEHRSRIGVMDAQLQINLAPILELVHRIDSVNAEGHQKTRAMIPNTRYPDRIQQSDAVAIITTEVELLSVADDQERQSRTNIQQEIIETFAYPEMEFSYERIVDAYPTTFEWVFREPTTDQLPWSNFSPWLKAGSGVYWINGKAGSGKSTMMKHRPKLG